MNVSGVGTLYEMQAERTPKSQLGNDFLTILAAQLQYQDPLSGGDNTQYVAQLAQFSSLEQMQNLNRSISELVYFQYVQYASQLVGKNITINDGQQLIQGVAEKVNMRNGQITVVVNGISYALHQVEEIGMPGERI